MQSDRIEPAAAVVSDEVKSLSSSQPTAAIKEDAEDSNNITSARY